MLMDYALPVEAVMAEEAALDTPQARLEGFAEWARRNPEAWEALWAKAREMAWRHQYVSTNYLINWLRFDTYIRISGGEIDTERTSAVLLDEFRAAKIGRITLDRIPEKGGLSNVGTNA